MKENHSTITIIILSALLSIIGIPTFFLFMLCAWDSGGYKCEFIPILFYLAVCLAILLSIPVLKFKNKILSITSIFIFSIYTIFFLIIFFSSNTFGLEDNYTICKIITYSDMSYSSTFSQNCMTNYAIKYDNISYCDKIKDPSKIDNYLCYVEIVDSPEEAYICETIPKTNGAYMTCYENIAIETNNESWCDYIYNSERGGNPTVSECVSYCKERISQDLK